MHHAANVITALREVATAEEIEHLALLCADTKVAMAAAEGDTAMLSRVFGVSCQSFEQTLKDGKGVEFRNYSGRFQITKAPGKVMLLDVEDDIFGTVGCAVIERLLSRLQSRAASTYLAGGRFKAAFQELYDTMDLQGSRLVAEQLPASYPGTTKQCRALLRVFDDAALLPMPANCNATQLAVWNEYLGALTTLMSQLRTSPNPITYRDTRPSTHTASVGEVILKRALDDAAVVPKEGDAFTEVEKQMLDILGLDGYEYVEVDGKETFVRVLKDVFSVIGDHFREPPELPDLDSDPVEVAAVAPPVNSPRSPVVSPSQGQSAAERLLSDFWSVDINKFPDEQRRLTLGGLSEEAQELWGGLSKIKKTKFLKALGAEEYTIPEAAALVATQLDLERAPALEEVVAARVLCAKSAFQFDKRRMTVRRR